ncbi:MAG: ATP-binding protein [Lachnospiraceae bacterium]|nr:ATP-binding protein [Lachnospiraceae bacterium]
MRHIDDLILYRDMPGDGILRRMTSLMESIEAVSVQEEEARSLFFGCVGDLVEMAAAYGFSGNLWHDYLTYLLVNHENAYTLASEIRGAVEGSLNELAFHDFRIFKELFDYDLTAVGRALGSSQSAVLSDFRPDPNRGILYNARIRDRICQLAGRLEEVETTEGFKAEMEQFYREYGVGSLGLHKAFRITHDADDQPCLLPITNIAHVTLDDLVGYEIPKKKLVDNTEAFINGRRANNCLLYGDAGTGKSTSVKALLNQYYDRGLRIIEVYKHQIRDINAIMAQIKNRHYKFIFFMDDLSFEEFEVEYKYLKAVIEGDLEKRPENVVIYATSNRRHLIKEDYADKEGRRYADMHSSDTVQEKLSLASRFGVAIYFPAPGKKDYNTIVRTLSARAGLDMDEETLLLEANKWEISHGGFSGRTASQFIDYLSGQEV